MDSVKDKTGNGTELESVQDRILREKSERPGNEAFVISKRRRWLERAILLFSGMLYATAFPELEWSYLGWVALIPLYWVVKEKTCAQAWRGGFLWGFGWSVASFFWLREIVFFIPFLMAPVLALFPAFWAMVIPFLRRYLLVPVSVQLSGIEEEKNHFKPVPLKEIQFVMALGAWWCLTEWVRSWIATGLPWNFLAVTQWRNLSLIQVAEFTGIYGVSFIIAIVNISLALAIENWYKGFSRFRRYQRPYPFILSLMILMLAVMTGSKSMLDYRKRETDIKLNAMVLQGDIPQCRQATNKQALFALKEYLELSELAVVSKPELIIWPETAVPYPFEYPGSVSNYYRFRVTDMAMKNKIPFLIGSIEVVKPAGSPENTPAEHYNSALLVGIDGKIHGRYRKIHRVPFGEYVPFGKYLPFLVRWIGMGRDLTPGREFNVIEVKKGVRAGVNICFEDIFPYVDRNLAANGANIFIVLSNDAWYPTSDEPAQHLANSVFRAVENRRPIIRCGNNSCSVLILPNGRIADSIFVDVDMKNQTAKPDLFRRGRGIANFRAYVRPNPPLTFYTRFPGAFIWFCLIIWSGTMLTATWAWREKKEALVAMFEE